MDNNTIDELKNLKNDIAEIQDDIKKLTRAVKSDGGGRLDDVRNRIKDAANDIENRIKEQLTDTYSDVSKSVKKTSQQAVDEGRQQIGKRPYATVGIAFLSGFVISKLLWKK
jgi:ElaB/YqjD/DUF883 family membrane-anchored ribosome-binding protein